MLFDAGMTSGVVLLCNQAASSFVHHVRRARIEFSLTPCSLSKAQIAIYQISFWLFLTPNSPALWGKKSMGIIPNILQKYQGQPLIINELFAF